jgi:membrane protein DedA with SNARE-associated domain
MDFLIALKVFILFLLPLPGMVLTAVIFYGLDNGLNGLVLTFIYLLNSITVVSIFNVFVGWIFERPRIKAKLIKKTEKWRERVKIYLGHHGLALGLMLAAYFVT